MTGNEGCDCYLGSASAGLTMLPVAAPPLSRGRMATEQMLPQPHLAGTENGWLNGPGHTQPPAVVSAEKA